MDDYKKKYEDALENLMLKMKDFDEITINREDVEEIFPELADSEERIRKEFCKDIWTFIPNEKAHKYIAWLEKQNDKRSVLNKEDEKIRKTLIEYFNAYPKDYYGELKKSHILAWLEKQGNDPKASYTTIVETGDGGINALVTNELLTDMDEPKFHEGDWIISKYMHLVMQILNNDNGSYKTVETDGTERNDSYDFIERNFKLWTIQDAKDGDILMANAPFIFNGNLEGGIGCPGAHCGINTLGEFTIPEYPKHWTGHTTTPAIKEQRELLFQKMQEAEYMWNSDSKQLLSLKAKPNGEQKPIDEDKTEIYDQFTPFEERLCALTHACQILSDEGKIKFIKKHSQKILDIAKEQIEIEQKPAWSEEDNRIIEEIINDIECARAINYHAPKEGYEFRENWLKSLKGRVQPQPKWSEEDEKHLKFAIDNFQTLGNSFLTSWLKSLKGRVQPKQEWSEEDEKIRDEIIEYLKDERDAFPRESDDFQTWIAWLEKQESHITKNNAVEPKCIYGRTLEERKRSCKYCSAACEARIKLVDEDLEEAANSYIGHPQEIDEDPAIFSKRKAYIAGAGWQWRRIMGEAIDAEIGSGSISSEAGHSVRLVHIRSNAKELKSGDKVKIIIIKEEE